MKNIEELLRDAFRAGMNKGSHQSYFDAPLDETEYIDSIKDELKLLTTPDVDVPKGTLCDCKKHSIKTSYGFKICTKCGNEWDV
jgi:hypothetical protein